MLMKIKNTCIYYPCKNESYTKISGYTTFAVLFAGRSKINCAVFFTRVRAIRDDGAIRLGDFNP